MCVTTANRAKGHGRQRGPGRELASWAASTRWTPQLSHRGGGGLCSHGSPSPTHTPRGLLRRTGRPPGARPGVPAHGGSSVRRAPVLASTGKGAGRLASGRWAGRPSPPRHGDLQTGRRPCSVLPQRSPLTLGMLALVAGHHGSQRKNGRTRGL